MRTKEIKEFREYLSLSFVKSDEIAVKMLDFLMQYMPTFEHRKMNFENAMDYCLPKGKSYRSPIKILQNTLSKMNVLLLDFIGLKEVQKRSNEANSLILQGLKNRKMDNAFFSMTSKQFDRLEKVKNKDLWDYWQQYLLQYRAYFHPNAKKYGKMNPQDDLKKMSKVFLDFVQLSGMLLQAEIYTRKLFFGEQGFPELPAAIVAAEEIKGKYEESFFFEIYDIILNSNKDIGAIATLKLKELVLEYKDRFGETKGTIFNFLINKLGAFLYYETQSDGLDFRKEVLDVYKVANDVDAFIKNGYLSHQQFKNMIIMAADLQEFDWGWSIYKEYQDLLQEENKEYTLTITKAYLDFNRAILDSSIVSLMPIWDSLGSIKGENISYRLRKKVLQLRLLYEFNLLGHPSEWGLPDPLEFGESFRLFIRQQNQLSTEQKISLTGFSHAVRFLINNAVDLEIYRFENDYLKKGIVCRSWLRKKASALK